MAGREASGGTGAAAVLGAGYLAAIICGVLMPVLDATLVSIGIDTLVKAFGSTTAEMQWVSTAYLLALAAAVPLSGWLLERLGGRRAWMGCLIGFVAASVGCAMSTPPSLSSRSARSRAPSRA